MSEHLSHQSTAEHPSSRGSSWSRRAEDDTSGGSRLMARLVTPFLAVVPWLMTMAGLFVLGRSYLELQQRLQTSWGWVLGGTALLVLAALVWAVVTAWSSAGTTVAGVCTLLLGGAFAVPELQMEFFALIRKVGFLNHATSYGVFSTMNFMLYGSLLLAGGLGAAGSRRLRR